MKYLVKHGSVTINATTRIAMGEMFDLSPADAAPMLAVGTVESVDHLTAAERSARAAAVLAARNAKRSEPATAISEHGPARTTVRTSTHH